MIKETDTYINYPKLVEEAMRGIVKKLLMQAAAEGLHGSHYFLLTFLTNASGVELSSRLLKRYPNEMTIILQHQYEDLRVTEDDMIVRLSFDGIKENVKIPLSALTAFVDPSTRFALQFNPDLQKAESPEKNLSIAIENHDNSKVVSLDQFRKKNR
ncbi:MAG: ClpXP protease specificity-enhancing factor SspB [Rickettsiaceae bacterium]|nr:ClpXP protease specificity-enhancing factor SspB [Rickettsiaceae bacterium]